MKILCDVCGEGVALVFCCADEATLCGACDRRIHRANKLAGKHRRFLLSTPSAKTHPACDICQEKRGYLFCQEDRAILCKDCDDSVHSANHLTMKHNRFLLTGVRLSAAAPISASPSPEPEEITARGNNKAAIPWGNQNKVLVPEGSSFPIASTASAATASTTAATSTISDYLTKMCPGWRVEDLLVDDAAVAMEDFAKKEGQLLPLVEPDLDAGVLEPAQEKFPIFAPHVPQFPPSGMSAAGGDYHPWHASKEAILVNYHEGRRWGESGGARTCSWCLRFLLLSTLRGQDTRSGTTEYFGASL